MHYLIFIQQLYEIESFFFLDEETRQNVDGMHGYCVTSNRTRNYVHLPFTDFYYVLDLYILSHDFIKKLIDHMRQMKKPDL